MSTMEPQLHPALHHTRVPACNEERLSGPHDGFVEVAARSSTASMRDDLPC